MYLTFSKKIDGSEHAIIIDRICSSDKGVCLVLKDKTLVKENLFLCSEVKRLLTGYYQCKTPGARDPFDKLFPPSFKEIAKIIGITNTQGNYFEILSDDELGKLFQMQTRGRAYIDYGKPDKDYHQALYITEIGYPQCEIDQGYSTGEFGKIEYNGLPAAYWYTMADDKSVDKSVDKGADK